MQLLVERVRTVGVHIGGGMIRVDEIINHQVDPALMMAIGSSFAGWFGFFGAAPTKVLTAESSGICPAVMSAYQIIVPMVYARKRPTVTMVGGRYRAAAPSRTQGEDVELIVAQEYLGSYDRVAIVEDFLGTGKTIGALTDIVRQARAGLVFVGVCIEKLWEDGRAYLEELLGPGVPIVSLVMVDLDGDRLVVESGRFASG